jgi:membrane dipeptidase
MTRSAARDLIRREGVWDMTLPWMPESWDIDVLRRFHDAGVSFISLTLQDWWPTFKGTLDAINKFKELVSKHADWICFAFEVSAIEAAREAGKLALGINSQEFAPVGKDLRRLRCLHDAGMRQIVLAYNVRNIVADGCAEAADAGLSNYGRLVVSELNALGITIDCSHVGRRSSLEAIELSSAPIIFSHSGVFKITPHIRNLTDEQISACAKANGVIGIVGVGAFLGDFKAQTESIFRHIDYVAQLAGIDNVGLGTDYIDALPMEAVPSEDDPAEMAPWPSDAISWPDPGYGHLSIERSYCFPPERLSMLVEHMLNRGYSEADVAKVLSGNFKRVYQQCAAVAGGPK